MGLPSFSAVFRAHHDAVWRALWRQGVEQAAIDDATQDVFMVVHRKLSDFDGPGSLRAWVLGIARNVALRHHQGRARTQRRPQLELVPIADPEQALEHKEALEFVDAFLERLDADKRAVFECCEIEGMTAVEAAELLGVKLNTVYSRLRLARRRFNDEVARHQARARRRDAWTA